MCGIVGILHRSTDARVEPTSIDRMCAAIEHRGPDDKGTYFDGSMGMGMRRLAIVDLAGGKQPIASEDGEVVVVYNGEIFNYQELKRELTAAGHTFTTRSDTEILVHGYEEWGLDLPRRLNGMFAFSIWDRRAQRLVIARDHIGVKPLYYSDTSDGFVWASEIKALLEAPGIDRRLDHQSLHDFLTFGYVPGPRTMFDQIRKVDPATILVVDRDSTRRIPYWDLEFTTEQRPIDDWVDELRSLVDDSVKRQLMSDVPLGAFLSGGIDSSAIVSSMSHLGVNRISTYAIGFSGKDAFHSELHKAAYVASQFETDHHEIIVEPDVADLLHPLIRHLDEPFTDTSFLVTYLVSKLARETVTVILAGIGGDEIFGGYRRYLGPRLTKYYERIPRAIRNGVIAPMMRRLPVDRGSRLQSFFRYARGFCEHASLPDHERYQSYVGVFNGDMDAIFSDDFARNRSCVPSDHVARLYANAPSDDPLNRMLYADLKSSLVDSLLTFTDKMSMAVSLEARVPLLDYRLVELAAKMPGDLKLRGLRGLKYVFKQALGNRLPRSIIHQKKQGFGTPINRWLRGALRPLVEDMLSPERLRQRGYFDALVVRRLIDDHLQHRADNTEHILALLTFEIWHQEYLD